MSRSARTSDVLDCPTTGSGGAPSGRVARRSACAVGCLTLVAAATVLVAPTSGASRAPDRVRPSMNSLVVVGGVPSRPFGARRSGSLASSRVISLGVALRPRDSAALSAFAQAVSMPGSSLYHRYLTPRTFAADFGPTVASTAVVERALRESRLRVGTVSANGLIVPVTGTVGEVDAAFHTRLVAYRLASGMEGWAPSTAPRLPARMAHAISAVLGLDNLVVPHSMMVRARNERSAASSAASGRRANPHDPAAPTACAAATANALVNHGWTEDEIAQAYGLTGLYAAGGLGGGQTIGVLELEPFLRSDISAFDECFFGPDHTTVIRTIPVDGFDLQGSGTGEAVLDLEMLAALAPEAQLDVYEAPNTSFGPVDALNAMVSADQANILSTSWARVRDVVAGLRAGHPADRERHLRGGRGAGADGVRVVRRHGIGRLRGDAVLVHGARVALPFPR